MSFVVQGRTSDSPYIEMVWHGHVIRDYAPVCPADVRWNLLFAKRDGRIRVSVEGPTTGFVPKTQSEGSEFLVIKFKLGTFMPYLPASKLVDADAFLPEGAGKSFCLDGSTWQFPDFDNVEIFVERLVRQNILVIDPLVSAAAQQAQQGHVELSERTLRRRFLYATGLTHKTIQQIERAQQAAALLEQGTPILDAVYQLGYADQPHLTRSLRRFIGSTPAQIIRAAQVQV
ncbi:MAG: AraC family transcriptional regulator [Anaerolineae bacterium]